MRRDSATWGGGSALERSPTIKRLVIETLLRFYRGFCCNVAFGKLPELAFPVGCNHSMCLTAKESCSFASNVHKDVHPAPRCDAGFNARHVYPAKG